MSTGSSASKKGQLDDVMARIVKLEKERTELTQERLKWIRLYDESEDGSHTKQRAIIGMESVGKDVHEIERELSDLVDEWERIQREL